MQGCGEPHEDLGHVTDGGGARGLERGEVRFGCLGILEFGGNGWYMAVLWNVVSGALEEREDSILYAFPSSRIRRYAMLCMPPLISS